MAKLCDIGDLADSNSQSLDSKSSQQYLATSPLAI